MNLLYSTIFGFALGAFCGYFKLTPPAPLDLGPVVVLAAIVLGHQLVR